MLPALGSPEVSPGLTDTHQLQRLCQFHLQRGDNKRRDCREREGVARMESGWRSSSKDMACPNRAAEMGRNAHPPRIFCFTFCLQDNAEQQMSVTKKLKNKETHKT